MRRGSETVDDRCNVDKLKINNMKKNKKQQQPINAKKNVKKWQINY